MGQKSRRRPNDVRVTARAPRAPDPPPPGAARARFRRIAFIVTALILAALALASVRRVAPGERVFEVGRFGGGAGRLAPGLHLVPPGLSRLVVVPPDPLKEHGEVALRTPEGAEVKVSWTIEAAVPDAALAALIGDSRGAADPGAAMRRAAGESIETWGRGASM